MTSEALVARAGITYRQLDWWTRRGYLKPDHDWEGRHSGTGTPREWMQEECRVAMAMGRLVQAGLRVDVAHRVARSGTEDGVLAALRA